MRRAAFLATALALLCCAPASAGKAEAPLYYLPPAAVDLTVLLAPPPDPNSPLMRYDEKKMAQVLTERTPADLARAAADEKRTVFVFTPIVGAAFTAAKAPLAAALFKHASDDTERLIEAAKAYYDRPRPPGAPQTHGSYPSGHAAFAACTAILLSQMVPEKRDEIFQRASIFAESRIVAGVHYPSDVEAGWISGTVIASALLRQPKFQADFAAAKAEVRKALGLL
ncbi:MAG TPA: phosphatase PAP2 family protein [Verrucomicrobiae bacterium]|nr:phosphatase PAP2 family protein [Verrucomicrobiae bacterium]